MPLAEDGAMAGTTKPEHTRNIDINILRIIINSLKIRMQR